MIRPNVMRFRSERLLECLMLHLDYGMRAACVRRPPLRPVLASAAAADLVGGLSAILAAAALL